MPEEKKEKMAPEASEEEPEEKKESMESEAPEEEPEEAPSDISKSEEEQVEKKIQKAMPRTAEPAAEEAAPEIVEAEEEAIEIVEPAKTKKEKKVKKVEKDEEEEEEEKYKVKPKPELGADEKHALSLRAIKRSKKPKFRRQEWFRYGRLGENWRKPRGMHSKTRRNYRYRAPKVSMGYRGPKTVRGRHSSGFEDILVHSPKELDGLDPKKQAARIGHTVGTRKRIEIKEKADELGIRILNWGS